MTGAQSASRITLLTLLVSTGSGCAMSPSAYESLAGEVRARNDERHAAAVARFRADGYEFVADATRLVVLDEPGTERCRQRRIDRSSGAALEVDTETLQIQVFSPNPDGGASTPRPGLTVAIDAACAFFGGATDELSGVAEDGTATELLRVTRAIARDSAGELVWVEVVRDVVSERVVLVEETCNEMPNPGPEPFERPPGPIYVIPSPAPTRQVRLEVEYEELDYECTDVVE